MRFHYLTEVDRFYPSPARGPLPGKRLNSAKYILTVAYEVKDGYLHVGWALCQPGDNFSKKFGREKAKERLEKTDISASEFLFGRPLISAIAWLDRESRKKAVPSFYFFNRIGYTPQSHMEVIHNITSHFLEGYARSHNDLG